MSKVPREIIEQDERYQAITTALKNTREEHQEAREKKTETHDAAEEAQAAMFEAEALSELGERKDVKAAEKAYEQADKDAAEWSKREGVLAAKVKALEGKRGELGKQIEDEYVVEIRNDYNAMLDKVRTATEEYDALLVEFYRVHEKAKAINAAHVDFPIKVSVERAGPDGLHHRTELGQWLDQQLVA